MKITVKKAGLGSVVEGVAIVAGTGISERERGRRGQRAARVLIQRGNGKMGSGLEMERGRDKKKVVAKKNGGKQRRGKVRNREQSKEHAAPDRDETDGRLSENPSTSPERDTLGCTKDKRKRVKASRRPALHCIASQSVCLLSVARRHHLQQQHPIASHGLPTFLDGFHYPIHNRPLFFDSPGGTC